jgi:hypothetical protein
MICDVSADRINDTKGGYFMAAFFLHLLETPYQVNLI